MSRTPLEKKRQSVVVKREVSLGQSNYPNELIYPNEVNEVHQQPRTTSQAFTPPSGKVGGACCGFGGAALEGRLSDSLCCFDSRSISVDEA